MRALRRTAGFSPRLGVGAAAVAMLVAGLVVACGGGDTLEVSSGTVITNATIVDTRDGSLTTGKTVVISGSTILAITDRPVQASGTAQAIDATGKYIVPGFLDMHTHLFNASDADLPLLENLFIANGITGIREMGGSPAWVQRARQFNIDRAAAKFDAPEILAVPGRIVGFPAIPGFDGSAPAAAAVSASAATLEVQTQKAYGVGFVKTIGANRDATLALLAEAKAQGLGVAGHLNASVSARDSSNAGWRAIEHLGAGMGTLLDCSTDEDAIRATLVAGNGVVPAPNPPSWTANVLNAPLYQRVHDTYDATRCQTVAQTFAKNDTWHVPTLIRLRTGLFVDDALYRSDPNLMYVSKSSRASWEAAATRQLATFPASAIATYHQYFERDLALTKLMMQNSVKLLAGSDTSINPILSATWVIPGFSLHQEFGMLAAAGLSPLQVLQMTTLNGARFLNREATMGTVDEAKNADLVLLDANPLDNVANLDRIWAVVTIGRFYNRSALDKLLAGVASTYSTQPLAAVDHALQSGAHRLRRTTLDRATHRLGGTQSINQETIE